MPEGRPRAVPDLPQELPDRREWAERVAHEVRHQEVIKASFDRAEAYARVGDFERAVEWLDRAATASGGLPPLSAHAGFGARQCDPGPWAAVALGRTRDEPRATLRADGFSGLTSGGATVSAARSPDMTPSLLGPC